MRLAAHLKISPHGVFYFRVVIPARLRPMFDGRREIKKSLATRDPKLAKLWAYALSAQVNAKFEKARGAMNKGYDPALFNPNDPGTWPGTADASPYELEVLPGGGLKVKVDPNSPTDHQMAMEAAKLVLDNPYLRGQQEKARVLDEAQRAAMADVIEQSMVKKAVQTNPPVAPTDAGGYQPIRLSEAVAYYRANCVADFKPSSLKKYNAAFNWFSAFFASDPFMHEIDDEVIRNWKNEVVIPHFQKIADDKMDSDIAKGRLVVDPMVGRPKVMYSIRSVDSQFTILNTFFQRMQDDKRYPGNRALPTRKQTVVSHAERKRLPGWKMFEEADLKKIFDQANLLHRKKPHEFWMPLLCLFTGGRIGELSQLTHNDIHEEDGIWVMRIRDEEYFQALKTDVSRRKIPLHPKLIELGFLDYLADARSAVKDIDRIFPYLRHDENNGFGDVPGEAFRRYLDDLGIFDRKKTSHSFRKNSNDCLKQNGVDEAARCQLVGHVHETTNNMTYSNSYPMGYLLKNVTPKLDFPQIDFSGLKYLPGRFKEMLPKEVRAAIQRKRKGKEESVRLHEVSSAAREARNVKVRRGRPPKAPASEAGE